MNKAGPQSDDCGPAAFPEGKGISAGQADPQVVDIHGTDIHCLLGFGQRQAKTEMLLRGLQIKGFQIDNGIKGIAVIPKAKGPEADRRRFPEGQYSAGV